MEQYNLRSATNEDTDFFYDVNNQVLKKYIEDIWGWDEVFQIRFHQENFHVDDIQIIMMQNTAIGTVEVKETTDQIFISSLYILPSFQNKGIGTNICKTYLLKAELANKRIALEVLKLNVNAQRLYDRLGFTLTDRDETKYLMFKDFKK